MTETWNPRDASDEPKDSIGTPRGTQKLSREPQGPLKKSFSAETAIPRHIQDRNHYCPLHSKALGALYNLYPIGIVKAHHILATKANEVYIYIYMYK